MSGGFEFVVDNFWNFIFGVPKNRPGGLVMTFILSATGLGTGLALAVAVSSARRSASSVLRRSAEAYVRVFRGIPLVLLMLIVHRLLSTATTGGSSLSLLAAIVALALYASAYQADIIVSGLRAVPKNVVEDARVLGASRTRAYLLLELPYGLRVMRPALLSQGITLFKDSSVVVILGVADLTTTARIALGADVENAPHWVATYLTVGAIYFAVAFTASRLVEHNIRSSKPKVKAVQDVPDDQDPRTLIALQDVN